MPNPASVARRFGAAFYDLLIVAALWMLVYFSLIAAGAVGGTLADNSDPRHWLLRGAIAFLYFAWSWTRSGRTLGLLTWSLALQRHDGGLPTLGDAAKRFGLSSAYLIPVIALEFGYRMAVPPLLFYTALLGPFLLGTLWALRDPQGRALHERVLATQVVMQVKTT